MSIINIPKYFYKPIYKYYNLLFLKNIYKNNNVFFFINIIYYNNINFLWLKNIICKYNLSSYYLKKKDFVFNTYILDYNKNKLNLKKNKLNYFIWFYKYNLNLYFYKNIINNFNFICFSNYNIKLNLNLFKEFYKNTNLNLVYLKIPSHRKLINIYFLINYIFCYGENLQIIQVRLLSCLLWNNIKILKLLKKIN